MAPGQAPARIAALEQELSDFSYIVSHDLAASFRHVRAFCELLRQDASAAFTPAQAGYCAQIQAAADKGATMLEQLLVYSRLMRKPLERQDCELAGLIDTVRLQLGGELRQSGGEIRAGSAARLSVDRELFVQALRQLAGNAIKFRSEAPPVITVEVLEDNGTTRIRLSDNGIGLPDVPPERLFGMFYRGHPEGAYPGCGAGLAIARRILRRHGGELCFAACEAGAAVEIELPRIAPDRAA